MAVVFPVIILLLAEGVLRLCRFGYPTSFCLEQKSTAVLTENDKFLFRFYSPKTNLRPIPFAVAANKPPDTVRIVILGESAAAGTPDPAYSFGRILERMLQDQFPNKRVEVVNAAMRGVNSHILLPAAFDCVRLQPDLFIVYMGNNEAVGFTRPVLIPGG